MNNNNSGNEYEDSNSKEQNKLKFFKALGLTKPRKAKKLFQSKKGNSQQPTFPNLLVNLIKPQEKNDFDQETPITIDSRKSAKRKVSGKDNKQEENNSNSNNDVNIVAEQKKREKNPDIEVKASKHLMETRSSKQVASINKLKETAQQFKGHRIEIVKHSKTTMIINKANNKSNDRDKDLTLENKNKVLSLNNGDENKSEEIDFDHNLIITTNKNVNNFPIRSKLVNNELKRKHKIKSEIENTKQKAINEKSSKQFNTNETNKNKKIQTINKKVGKNITNETDESTPVKRSKTSINENKGNISDVLSKNGNTPSGNQTDAINNNENFLKSKRNKITDRRSKETQTAINSIQTVKVTPALGNDESGVRRSGRMRRQTVRSNIGVVLLNYKDLKLSKNKSSLKY